MSLVLTSGASRPPVVEVVDLTETPPPSPPSLDHIANGSRNGSSQPLLETQRQQHGRVAAQDEGPPFKKRRVDLSWPEKQSIACQQVSPYVSRGLADLSSSEYIIDEIAIRVWDTWNVEAILVMLADCGNRPFLYLLRIRCLYPDCTKTTIRCLPTMSGLLSRLT